MEHDLEVSRLRAFYVFIAMLVSVDDTLSPKNRAISHPLVSLFLDVWYHTCVDQGFDISFLVTHTHLEKLWKHKLIDFIIQFMEDIDKEISGMKIAINARGRIIAQQFMLQFVQ